MNPIKNKKISKFFDNPNTKNIKQIDNYYYIDEQRIGSVQDKIVILVNGNVGNIECAGSVVVNGNAINVNSGDSCEVYGNVVGNVDSVGSVTCGDVLCGNVNEG